VNRMLTLLARTGIVRPESAAGPVRQRSAIRRGHDVASRSKPVRRRSGEPAVVATRSFGLARTGGTDETVMAAAVRAAVSRIAQ
jgi:hypothetical protein